MFILLRIVVSIKLELQLKTLQQLIITGLTMLLEKYFYSCKHYITYQVNITETIELLYIN